MSQSIEELLQAATPRPWKEGDFSDDICGPLGPDEQPICGDFNDQQSQDWIANHSLVLLAVNTYEARTELIRQLTEALEEARICLVIEGYHHDTDTAQPYKIMQVVDAALEAAKKARE